MPAASIIAAAAMKDANNTEDRTLVLADVGRKAQHQVELFVRKLLSRHMSADRAGDLAHALSEGRWTHDFPINPDLATEFGLPVSTELPDEVRLLMRLYPQPRGRRPSVEYIPSPYDRPAPSIPRRDPQHANNGRRSA
jgi:ClpP class serine protease